MNLTSINELLGVSQGSLGEAMHESKSRRPRMRGKEVTFAELDGPFSTGPGGRGDFEQGEYVIGFYSDDDDELGFKSFRSYRQALAHLNKLAKSGVETSSMTGG